MKNIFLLTFLLSILFLNCKNASKVSENTVDHKTSNTAQKSKIDSTNSESQQEKILVPSEDENVDFWTANKRNKG